MNSLILVKLAGSLIPVRNRENSPDLTIIKQLINELRAALEIDPDLSIVLGQESGFTYASRAQFELQHNQTLDKDKFSIAEIAATAHQLNLILLEEMLKSKIRAFSIQPSAMITSEHGRIKHWNTTIIQQALLHGLLPVIYSDFTFDIAQGITILSVEQMFSFLALQAGFRPKRIILVENTFFIDIILKHFPLSRRIHPGLTELDRGIKTPSDNTIVNNILTKMELLFALIDATLGLEIQIIDATPGLLEHSLHPHVEPRGILIRDNKHLSEN